MMWIKQKNKPSLNSPICTPTQSIGELPNQTKYNMNPLNQSNYQQLK